MKNFIFFALGLLMLPATASAGGNDDPLLGKLMIDQFEIREVDGENPWAWEAEGWLGKDLHKLWIKTEGEHHEGRTENMEIQFLYSRAVDPNWDLQVGWRHDDRPSPQRDWLAIGFQGLAPYMIETDVALFIAEGGRTAARLSAGYELMFTQRLALEPEIEFNLYGQDDRRRGIGSGLSSIEAGLRLKYEIRREFAPYIGIHWEKKYGDSADIAEREGEDSSETALVLGISAWF